MRAMAIVLVAAGFMAGCVSPGTEAKEAPAEPWAGTGFSVWDLDGRWWVFREGSKDVADFRKGGEPAKLVTRIGAGPDGRTLRAPDAETLDAFAAWRPGFTMRWKDGRVWVFREKAKELADYDRDGELAKMVTRIGTGPGGTTLRSPDAETLDAWAAAK